MLRQTFQHINGFTEAKERELWKRHIFTWEDYNLLNNQLSLFTEFETDPILESVKMLQNNDFEYFTERLPKYLFYRIANSFPEQTIFLDIETTGLSHFYDDITLIGWSLNNNYKYILGNQFDKIDLLKQDLTKAACIVTFNGTLFDIPFLKKKIPDLEFPKCHVDLRFFSRRHGYQGGQKEIERLLKVNRPEDLKEVSGGDAVVLWYKYKEGDNDSLRKLIKYNAYDLWGMKNILEIICNQIINNEGISSANTKIYPFSSLHPEINYISNEFPVHSYNNKDHKRISLAELGNISNYRVIGIDLTGSEERATGWAYLNDGKAITKRIHTNAELISETVMLNPHVISIDSPLSLPKGRISPFDDDPGRNKYGILRECERMLKRRGVSSYPCLIPSMQRLTERGIHLADKFRKLGFTVIESYPGAAQDIMGIPRKRLSLDFLIKGLQKFGIYGQFDSPEVSHDEIDAITSAVVGYFFMADKYEALGNEDENYLIIPNLENKPKSILKKVIGISGSLASGKTTAGKILEKRGFVYSRYSLVLKNKLEEEGKEVNRKNLQEYGDYVNKIKGQRWLGQQLIKQFYDLQTTEYLVIDGLRFLEDPAFLRECFGSYFMHIHIQTDENLRKERYLSQSENNVGFQFANSHEVERETGLLLDRADLVITNNQSIKDLEMKIDKILE
jgi:uncharacterized protein YprB with RNaseH-like and TPR domain/predicted nuclease with RNAse H fold/dephospho-CoA kinase